MANAGDDDQLIEAESEPQGAQDGVCTSEPTSALQFKAVGFPKKQIFCRNYEKIGDTVLVNLPVPASTAAIGETNVFAYSVPYHRARSNCFLAWLSCVCFAPIGAVSIAFSALSTNANRKQNYVTAQAHGKTAHKIALAGIVIGSVVYSILVIVSFAGAIKNGGRSVGNNTFLTMELERFGI